MTEMTQIPDPMALGLRAIDSARKLLGLRPTGADVVQIGEHHSAAVLSFRTSTGHIELWASPLFPSTMCRLVDD